jgi:hypothetical protein
VDDRALTALLSQGEVEIVGRMPFSSNATFLVQATDAHGQTRAVYKPMRGERPLWDFPSGLYRREVAAYELSRDLGWDLVPVTICRSDGPLGEGSLQQFVEADFDQHYFTLHEEPDFTDRLRQICLFDLLANNTDRKAGHCLLGRDGRVYAIDNALCFHAEFKLRTVIWDFADEPIPRPLLAAVTRLVDAGLSPALASLLDGPEREALLVRARALLDGGRFPSDHTGRRLPWPMV